MMTLLLSCYELGHQPLSLAWPLAFLDEAGLAATAVDLSISPFPKSEAKRAKFVCIAAPMHTALRLGVEAARRVREINPNAHICFYGLYAWLNRDYLLSEGLADSLLAGEVERPLLAQIQAVLSGEPVMVVADPIMARQSFPIPKRASLPGLPEYAHYMHKGTAVPAGYVEASRGCLHTCRHCPIVPVYDGRFFIIPLETVMADIRQQVKAGARHITFGDPDFLNGPGHALNIARALRAEFPGLTFDFTVKVEHILRHRDKFPELAALGSAFVVSAFESVSETVLARLGKGHTVSDMETALNILAQAGIAVQPTWVAFTPWTTLADYLAMLDWIRRRGLIPHVPTVQYAVRLLIPPQSALLAENEDAGWLGALDAANFSYAWRHPDPRLDELHQAVSQVAEQMGDGDPLAVFAEIERLAYGMDGRTPPADPLLNLFQPAPPRLSENWFC